jgi:hypothetical protein
MSALEDRPKMIWWGGASSTIDIGNFTKWNYKEGEGWFEPLLSVHSPLSPHYNPNFDLPLFS